MLLLILSTLLDYTYGFWVASSDRKKAKLFLWLGIINNLGILAIFKYYNFFALQFQQSIEYLGFHVNPYFLNIALPVGISFYTFHGMSYVFDIYRGRIAPISNFIDYAVFVSFFPLLVAGPIERANHLLPQVQKRRNFNYTQAVEGCRLILWGMFKKVVIANSLAGIVDKMFENPSEYNSPSLIIGAVAFSFQIYGDFSGYSDIALGSAKLFGFELLSNFKFPYFSRDIAEFWRRWHISLSSWFRDYLYIPLGGSKNGKINAVRNTFIIFIVSGFWHGASWHYVIWGFIHACGFIPLLLSDRNRRYISDVVSENRRWPTFKEFWQMSTTFMFVTFAWIFFRANSLDEGIVYVKSIFSNLSVDSRNIISALNGKIAFLYIIPLIYFDWNFRFNERQLIFPSNRLIRIFIYAIFATLIITHLNLFMDSEKIEFIYFQF